MGHTHNLNNTRPLTFGTGYGMLRTGTAGLVYVRHPAQATSRGQKAETAEVPRGWGAGGGTGGVTVR